MNWINTLSDVGPVFVQGLFLSLGLIVAIGAQNAFVLRQGLRREHVGSVVAFCAVADALLITAGVLGMAQALGDGLRWRGLWLWAGRRFWPCMAGELCSGRARPARWM
jgi:arginine exporter protein ArgO